MTAVCIFQVDGRFMSGDYGGRSGCYRHIFYNDKRLLMGGGGGVGWWVRHINIYITVQTGGAGED